MVGVRANIHHHLPIDPSLTITNAEVPDATPASTTLFNPRVGRRQGQATTIGTRTVLSTVALSTCSRHGYPANYTHESLPAVCAASVGTWPLGVCRYGAFLAAYSLKKRVASLFSSGDIVVSIRAPIVPMRERVSDTHLGAGWGVGMRAEGEGAASPLPLP